MNQFWQFWTLSFVVMPALVVGLGYLALWLHQRDLRKHDTHPAE